LLVQKLNGHWNAWTDSAVADQFHQPEFAAAPEFFLPVPGHWQQEPALSQHQGSVFYRTTFEIPADYHRFCWRLILGGAFYRTNVWVNGEHLGQHDGYFQPMLWEIKSGLLRAKENVLAIRLDCPPPGMDYRQIVMGAYGDWDCKPAAVNPGGIWGDVLLTSSPGGFFDEATVETRLSAWNAAQIKVKGSLAWRDSEQALKAQIAISPRNFTGKSFTQKYSVSVSPGINQFNFKVSLPDPKLWWTWDLGHPSLYDLQLVLENKNGVLIDYFTTYMGLRTLKWDQWQLSLNGQRIFLRGCNYTPASFYPATLSLENLEQDAQLMVDAHLNFVRVHAHVARPEFYQAAAEKGLLIWQDFPLDKRYDHDIMGAALTQIRQMVGQLGKEPSIAFWACHNEPYALGLDETRTTAGPARFWGSMVRSARPTWNKDVLDSRLKAAVMQLDNSRPVFASSGVFGFLRKGSDTHQYFGWNTKHYRTLQLLGRFVPHTLRLVSEYGAQAWPLQEELLGEVLQLGEWPKLPWEEVRRRYMLDHRQLHQHVDPQDYQTLQEYALATQEYQAELLQFYHETLRLRRFHPCAGAAMFSFGDGWPVVSWSMLDWRRQPKLAYQVTCRAMSPVQVMVDWPKRDYRSGEIWDSHIYVVNDLHRPMPAMGLTWRLIAPTGEVLARERRIADAEPDEVTTVGRMRLQFPEDQEGTFILELTLDMPSKDQVENSYRLKVTV
jgi:beta-mannosidase